jgi:pilus assembly protein CpaB
MNGRSLILLGLAITFGLGAMFLTQRMMATSPKKEVEEQDVLVAARDLREEESLKPGTVKVVRMAKASVPPFAFSSYKDVEDRWVNLAMLEGDVLIEKKLGPKGSPPGLVNKIPKGMRALAIDVNESTGVAGFILPGHRVDVVRFLNSDRDKTKGETILEDVQVLAAGQTFIRPEERAVQSRTVTLAVTPDQVTTLIEARAKGPLSLSLRGVNDHAIVTKSDEKKAVDTELEKRLKEQEEARRKLERDLQAMKDDMARREAEALAKAQAPAPTLAPAPEPAPVAAAPAVPRVRYIAIYRAGSTDGGARPQLIEVDREPSDRDER